MMLNLVFGNSFAIFSTAAEDKDELLVAKFDLDMIEEVRSTWQFYRDRRPETYDKLVEL